MNTPTAHSMTWTVEMLGSRHPQHEQPIMSRGVAIHVKIHNAYAKSPTSVANGNGW